MVSGSLTRRLAIAVSCGLLAGVLAKIGDQSTWRWATDLGTYPSAWLFALVVIAAIGSSVRQVAILGGAFSVAAIASYYFWSSLVLGFSVGLFPILWMGVAVFVAPTSVAVIRLARDRGGTLSVLGATGISGLMLADGPIQQYWNELTIGLPEGFPFHPVQAGVAVALSLITIGIMVDSLRGRLTAAALAVPATVIAAAVIDVVWSAVPI